MRLVKILKKDRFFITLIFMLTLGLSNPFMLVFAQTTENLTITTYYPAPMGVYQRLDTETLGVGDNSADNFLSGVDAPPNDATHSGDVWVAGDIGVGTTTPQNRLDVNGGAVIGNAYAGTQAAPANGLLVQGNTGIGTSTVVAAAGTAKALQVNNTLVLTPSDSSSGYAQAGALYFDNVTKRFKYYDVTTASWKNLGGALGDTVYPPEANIIPNPASPNCSGQNNPSSAEDSHGSGATYTYVGAAATCPDGYVVTSINLRAEDDCRDECGDNNLTNRWIDYRKLKITCRRLN